MRRKGEADWFKKTGNIKCVDLNAYLDGDGCRCHYGNTLSTETEPTCRRYSERGNFMHLIELMNSNIRDPG